MGLEAVKQRATELYTSATTYVSTSKVGKAAKAFERNHPVPAAIAKLAVAVFATSAVCAIPGLLKLSASIAVGYSFVQIFSKDIDTAFKAYGYLEKICLLALVLFVPISTQLAGGGVFAVGFYIGYVAKTIHIHTMEPIVSDPEDLP